MRNVKGFVFTLDAIFSLIFAAGAISLLIYINYTSYSPSYAQVATASSALVALSNANINTLSNSTLVGLALSSAAAGQSSTWPQYGKDAGLSSGSAYGPVLPLLLYTYNAPTNIIPVPVVSGGIAAFAAGTKLYALNASTGVLQNNYPVTDPTSNAIVSSPLIYGRDLIYQDSSGNVIAVDTITGNTVWIYTPPQQASYSNTFAPLEVEDNYVMVSTKNKTGTGFGNIYFIDPLNGTATINPTQTTNGPVVYWMGYFAGIFYAGRSSSNVINVPFHHSNVTSFVSSSNPIDFAASGNYIYAPLTTNSYKADYYRVFPTNGATVAAYNNTAIMYNGIAGNIVMVSQAAYPTTYSISWPIAASKFDTTPSLGGNIGYFLSNNGLAFTSYGFLGQRFNVTLPSNAFFYNYSNVALAYGKAYVPNGNTLYVFGIRPEPSNESVLAALAHMYLTNEGGLADMVLSSVYNATNIAIYINRTLAPSLHVAKFNGVNSYAFVPAKSSLSPEAGSNGAMSLCSWYKINSLTGYNGLIYKGTTSPSSGSVPEFAIDPAGANGIRQGFQIYSSSNNIIAYAYANNAISSNSVGKWFFSCAAFNSTNSTYYLNTTRYVGNVISANGVASQGSGRLIFGAGRGGYSNVSIANVQLYNTSLSQQQVSGIYYRGMFGAPLNTTNLLGWWPLLGDTSDYSSQSNTAFPFNVIYTSVSYAPQSLLNAYQISKASLPIPLLNSNGVYNTYNVSVVVWTN